MRRPPRRGDIYWVALDPSLGTEIRKTRPAIVVSNDSCNTYGSRVVVIPITSNVSSLYPGESLVTVQREPARALGDQIRSIDKRRLRNRVGRLTQAELRDVDQALRVTLALVPG
jgi:mRNA interferase MazF